MVFKTKKYEYDIDFGTYYDLGFWALPLSICWINIPQCHGLDKGFHILVRVLCFQFSCEMWRWDHGEVVDVNDSIGDMIDGR